jgi:hypothetical protein
MTPSTLRWAKALTFDKRPRSARERLLGLFPALCLQVALMVNPALAQADLAVTPSLVTNNYSGTITFAIDGVPAGASLAVEKYLDVNENGLIDDQEPVVQGFTLTDGQLPVIGGVRNINVPGDEDGSADGQLRTEVRFPGVEPISGGMPGRFLFRVRGVNVTIEPATNTFEVRQEVLAQGVSGRVTDAVTGLPLGYAMVGLVRPYGLQGTIVMAGANGDSTVYGEPGPYLLAPARRGYVGRPTELTLGASIMRPSSSFLPWWSATSLRKIPSASV